MPTESYGHRIVCQAIFHGGWLARLVRIRVTEHERSASGSISTGLSRRKIKPLPAEVVIGSIVFPAGATERDPSRPNQVTGSLRNPITRTSRSTCERTA